MCSGVNIRAKTNVVTICKEIDKYFEEKVYQGGFDHEGIFDEINGQLSVV